MAAVDPTGGGVLGRGGGIVFSSGRFRPDGGSFSPRLSNGTVII